MFVKRPARGDQSADYPEILQNVARHAKLPSGFQRSLDLPHELGCEDPALLVAGLPPRIGKVHVHAEQALIGNEPRHDQSSIAAPDFGVLDLVPSEPRRGLNGILAGELDTQVVHAGPRLRRAHKEKTLSRADFELDRIGIPEEARPVDWRRRFREPSRVDKLV